MQREMPSTPDQDLHPVPLEDQSQFTVFIRLPFPRGDFVDPPPVEWNSSKDRALWDILSRASKGREVDWQALAEKFDVTLSFLLQQAAWLYEQQLSQVKAQLRKATRPASISSSPTPGSTSGSTIAGGHAMTRGSSGGSRVPSASSKDPPVSQDEGSKIELPNRARETQISRNSSTNTVSQIPNLSSTIPQHGFVERQPNLRPHMKNREGSRKSMESQTRRPQFSDRPASHSDNVDESSSSSSSSESDTSAQLSRSRAYVRRSRYSSSKPPLGPLSDADEDQEDSTPFLPFSDARILVPPKPSDPSATVRIISEKPSSKLPVPSPLIKPEVPGLSLTGHSSSSSTQSQSQRSSRNARVAQNALSSLSPRQRRIAKEGSEGTPSMGSSFSDLDDASVTQSALEEALANEMNHGGVASRMSTISQALRSRYL